MLKIVYRTLIIVLVASLVAGGLYLFVQTGGTGALNLSGGRGERSAFLPTVNGAGAASRQTPSGQGFSPPSGGQRGEHSQTGLNLSWQGLSGLVSPLVKIAGITLAVACIQAISKRLKRRRVRSQPTQAALTGSLQS